MNITRDCRYMFEGCSSLTTFKNSLDNSNLTFNISVTDADTPVLIGMFKDCASLTTVSITGSTRHTTTFSGCINLLTVTGAFNYTGEGEPSDHTTTDGPNTYTFYMATDVTNIEFAPGCINATSVGGLERLSNLTTTGCNNIITGLATVSGLH